MPSVEAREAAIKSTEDVFENNHDDYGRKLFLIENCIYGVDIQPIAVQIAKLRFFISLVVDQKTNPKKANLGIRPLPNLETKFVAANTLIGINRPDTKPADEQPVSISPEVEEACNLLIRKLEHYLNSRNDDLRAKHIREAQEYADAIKAGMGNDFQPLGVDWIFTTAKDTATLKALLPLKRDAKASALMLRNQEIQDKEKELERVRREHFSARTPATKRKYRDLDKNLRREIADLLSKNYALEDATAQQLAGWDPYNQNAHADFFDPEWMFGIEGGFDVVIGNPPYLRVQGIQSTQGDYMPYYRDNFESATGSFDLYALFIEKGYKLLNQKGRLAYIVPHKFFQASFGVGLRRMLTQKQALNQIVRFGHEQVFDAATTYTCLIFLSAQNNTTFDLLEITNLQNQKDVLEAAMFRHEHPDYLLTTVAEPSLIETNPSVDWDFSSSGNNIVLLKLYKQNKRLQDVIRKMFQGIPTGLDKVFILKVLQQKKNSLLCYSEALDSEVEIEQGFLKPFLMGKDVHRYQNTENKNVVLFPYDIKSGSPILLTANQISDRFPKAWSYLKKNEKALKAREDGRFVDIWHSFSRPQNLIEFEKVKIITPEIANAPNMTLDSTGFYHTTKVYSFVFKDDNANIEFYLGLLNSKVLWYFLTQTGYVLRGGYFTFKTDYLKPFPVPETTPEQEKPIAKLVTKILTAKRANSKADTSKLEREIDQLVYQLYGLTDEEIGIVEGQA